jgi:hypothetical protein
MYLPWMVKYGDWLENPFSPKKYIDGAIEDFNNLCYPER